MIKSEPHPEVASGVPLGPGRHVKLRDATGEAGAAAPVLVRLCEHHPPAGLVQVSTDVKRPRHVAACHFSLKSSESYIYLFNIKNKCDHQTMFHSLAHHQTDAEYET